MKVNRPRIAIAGRAAGTADVPEGADLLAPSMRAASISSSGMTSTRYCRMKKTPNAVTRVGTMTAPIVPVQPSCAHQHEQRDDAELGRDRDGRDHEDHEPVAALEPQLREGVAGEGREGDDGYRDHRRDDDRVAAAPARTGSCRALRRRSARTARRAAAAASVCASARLVARPHDERPVERVGAADDERGDQPVGEPAGATLDAHAASAATTRRRLDLRPATLRAGAVIGGPPRSHRRWLHRWRIAGAAIAASCLRVRRLPTFVSALAMLREMRKLTRPIATMMRKRIQATADALPKDPRLKASSQR